MKNRRVFLKLSGEALAGPKKTGFDEDTVKEVARQVKASVDAGVQVGVVIGGGNADKVIVAPSGSWSQIGKAGGFISC